MARASGTKKSAKTSKAEKKPPSELADVAKLAKAVKAHTKQLAALQVEHVELVRVTSALVEAFNAQAREHNQSQLIANGLANQVEALLNHFSSNGRGPRADERSGTLTSSLPKVAAGHHLTVDANAGKELGRPHRGHR